MKFVGVREGTINRLVMQYYLWSVLFYLFFTCFISCQNPVESHISPKLIKFYVTISLSFMVTLEAAFQYCDYWGSLDGVCCFVC